MKFKVIKNDSNRLFNILVIRKKKASNFPFKTKILQNLNFKNCLILLIKIASNEAFKELKDSIIVSYTRKSLVKGERFIRDYE